MSSVVRSEETQKPILCLDFDGVIHSYASGWKGLTVIPDPPTPGLFHFLADALAVFRIAVYSSRSAHIAGITAMQEWLLGHAVTYFESEGETFKEAAKLADTLVNVAIEWPAHKPSAFVTLDDRAVTFTGYWPDVALLRTFEPWGKKKR